MNNLLAQAHQLIPKQTISYSVWKESSTNDNMLDVDEYEPAVERQVKINAVKSSLIKKLGLDYKKNYVHLYSIKPGSGLDRTNNGDQFTFDGIKYQVLVRTGWQATAGWDSFVCIEVPK